jgi:hypothetical protein
MKVLLFLGGFGVIRSPDETAVVFKAGDCLLVPASYKGVAHFEADTLYLIITIRMTCR